MITDNDIKDHPDDYLALIKAYEEQLYSSKSSSAAKALDELRYDELSSGALDHLLGRDNL